MLPHRRCHGAFAVVTTMFLALLVAQGPAATLAVKVQHMSFWDNQVNVTNSFTTFDFNADDPATAVYNKAHGIDNLYYVLWTFFDNTGPQGAYVLRPDWQSYWGNVSATAKPLFDNGTIFGFFMGDELVWNGLDPASLITAVDAVRADFPKATIWANEAVPPMRDGTDRFGNKRNYTIPRNLSWISIDMYHTNGPNASFVHDNVRAFYEQYVYTKMAPGQLATLVPGSFASDVNQACNFTCYDTMCAIDADGFYQWAQQDERVVAIAPWHWKRCDGCEKYRDEIGTQSLIKTKAAWQKIGTEIRNGNDAGQSAP